MPRCATFEPAASLTKQAQVMTSVLGPGTRPSFLAYHRKYSLLELNSPIECVFQKQTVSRAFPDAKTSTGLRDVELEIGGVQPDKSIVGENHTQCRQNKAVEIVE